MSWVEAWAAPVAHLKGGYWFTLHMVNDRGGSMEFGFEPCVAGLSRWEFEYAVFLEVWLRNQGDNDVLG